MQHNILGVIFDLDGVIVSTDDFHYMAWKALADDIGIQFDKEINNRLRGVSRRESLMIILENNTTAYTADEIDQMLQQKNTKYVTFLKGLSSDHILPGILETLEHLRLKGIKIAIGSSSRNAERILKQIGLDGVFDAVVDGTHIEKSKPDPEVFLKAGKALNIEPEKLLVVEDAYSGVLAAKAAGMKVIGVGDAMTCEDADYHLESLTPDIIDDVLGA